MALCHFRLQIDVHLITSADSDTGDVRALAIGQGQRVGPREHPSNDEPITELSNRRIARGQDRIKVTFSDNTPVITIVPWAAGVLECRG